MTNRGLVVFVAALWLIGAGVVAAVLSDRFGGWLENTAPLAEWLVAAGTFALAFATYTLATRAADEASAVRDQTAVVTEQVTLQREQLEASQRPHVFPAPNLEWTAGSERYAGRWNEVLPVRNGGPGVALNVFGQLQWPPPSGVFAMLIPTSLGPNTAQDMALDTQQPRDDWENLKGFLEYEDVTRTRWRTRFHIQSRRLIRVLETERVEPGDETPGYMSSQPMQVGDA